MADTFDCIVGLSDHTLGDTVAIASVAMGAKIIEKHLTLSRKDGGVDADFSMEPDEFKLMVDHIRVAEKAIGTVSYDLTDKQVSARQFSRSLFITKDMKVGEVLTEKNMRSIRPANGLHTKYYEELLGRKVAKDVKAGTPLSWDIIENR